ncbi:MAG TPA: ATP-dependent Clp protease proteolytic subunit [Anaerolineales bacterium]|nr:ATP-dependent Clp protease proteolytic subunit [Anaerolineales bacterium]
MESWIDIQSEIARLGAERNVPGGHDFDGVRRESYTKLVELTGRPLIVYASAYHVPIKQGAGQMLSLDLSDKDGFQEVLRNIDGAAVDVFVHSPGGSAEATESIVAMLRSKFDDVRFIVTGSAKSAATMLVMSGNRILMTDAGELGPTDPQFLLGNRRASPAGAILDQFKLAKKEIAKQPNLIGPWLPILQQYGPSLVVECENHIDLSENLVAGWLEKYMFKGMPAAKRKAKKLSAYLADDKNFLSHGRRVDITALRTQGAIVDRVEDLSVDLQRAISRVHLAIMATLDGTAAVKIFENSAGAVLIRLLQMQVNIDPRPVPGH